MINPAIQRSIEVQDAARKCGIIKPKMTRIVNRVNKVFPHYSADMIANHIIDASQPEIFPDLLSWEIHEITDLIIEFINL